MQLPITTPTELHSDLLEFAVQLSSRTAPVFVSVSPLPGSKPANCFFNVGRAADEARGRARFGWLIWEHAGRWLEAERHAVLEKPTGDLVDVTPQPDGESETVFLEDPSWEFDYTSPKPTRRVRHALSTDPVLLDWVSAIERLEKFQWQHRRFIGEDVKMSLEREKDARRLNRLQEDVTRAQAIALHGGRR